MTKIITDEKAIDEVLNRGNLVEFFPNKKEFRDKLLSGDKLRIYIGFDATAPALHFGHARNFLVMEKFRQLGHETIILFGDFTGRIGDPSDKTSARQQLTRKQVVENISGWKDQVKSLIDFESKDNPAKIMFNNDWLSKLTLEDVVNLASNFTVQQMLERDMFQKRLKDGKPIHLHEFLYPLMQGYDSVAMDVDVEFCGTDQIFNALAGRTLIKKLKNKDKFVVVGSLISNPQTGELMSKSNGTGIFLDIKADEMFGQIMAQPDPMIEVLFINLTNLPLEKIEEIMSKENPRDAKLILATEIVKMFHGQEKANIAKDNWEKTFSKKEIPKNVQEVIFRENDSIYEPLHVSGAVSSMSSFRRLIDEGAVTHLESNEKVKNYKSSPKTGTYRIGKKTFRRLKKDL